MSNLRVSNEAQTSFSPPSPIKKIGITILVLNVLAALGSLAFLLNHYQAFSWQATWLNSSLAPNVLALSITTFTVLGGVGIFLLNKPRTKTKDVVVPNEIQSSAFEQARLLKLATESTFFVHSGDFSREDFINTNPLIKNAKIEGRSQEPYSNIDEICASIKQEEKKFKTIFYFPSLINGMRASECSYPAEILNQLREAAGSEAMIIFLVRGSIDSFIDDDSSRKQWFVGIRKHVLDKENTFLISLTTKANSASACSFSDGFNAFIDQLMMYSYEGKRHEFKQLLETVFPRKFLN